MTTKVVGADSSLGQELLDRARRNSRPLTGFCRRLSLTILATTPRRWTLHLVLKLLNHLQQVTQTTMDTTQVLLQLTVLIALRS